MFSNYWNLKGSIFPVRLIKYAFWDFYQVKRTVYFFKKRKNSLLKIIKQKPMGKNR